MVEMSWREPGKKHGRLLNPGGLEARRALVFLERPEDYA